MMKRKGDFQSIGEVSATMRREGLLPGSSDLSSAVCSALHLKPGSISVRIRENCLLLSSTDKTVRCAVSGMESQLLAWIAGRGYKNVRRIKWSAE